MRRPEPTHDELRSAWQHCVRRASSHWPPTFQEAMAHPLLSRLVRITAMHPPRPHRAPPPRTARFYMPPATFDRKRAAAGDRDDD